MNHILASIPLTILAVSLGLSPTIHELYAQSERQLGVVDTMRQADPNMRIRWNRDTGAPARVAGHLSERIDGDAKEIVMRFFSNQRALFSMTNAEQELAIMNTRKDPRGKEHVKVQQMYKSLPVEGKQISVHINQNKEVELVHGDYLPNIDLDPSAAIQRDAAVETATRDLEPKNELAMAPKTELVVYESQGQPVLAWKILLASNEPLGDFVYYVNAKTGEVIDSYNDMKNVLNRKTYHGRNTGILPGDLTRSEGDSPTNDAAIDDAHDHAGQVYQYYLDEHGRDSYDGQGADIVSTAHHRQGYNNAAWSPFREQMFYGDGDGTRFTPLSESLDVVAHELTHAITDKTTGLVYRNQSGALNESISDIFGVAVDPSNWMLGEDIFTPAIPGDALRHVDDPPRGGQPDHMDDFVTPDPNGSAMDRRCFAATNQDNGCVHFNSGIPNKAAYLMAEGGTHHGLHVQGMGLSNVTKIFFDVQANLRLTAQSDFLDARDATVDAVNEIFPGDQTKKCTVERAWAAVGIGEPCQNGESNSDLALTKTSSAVSVEPGEMLTYTLSVMNQGPDPATGVTVTDILPAGFVFSSASSDCHHDGGRVTCSIGELGVDDKRVVTMTGIAPSQQGMLKNTAKVSGDQVDPQSDNNSASVSTTIGGEEPFCRSPELDISTETNVEVSDVLTIDHAGTLKGLTVSLDITHSYVGDIVVTLEHEGAGPTAVLLHRPIFTQGNCQFNDVRVTLHDESAKSVQETCDSTEPAVKGTVQPNESLGGFAGQELSGSWKLKVLDDIFQDGGKLNKWCLIPELE